MTGDRMLSSNSWSTRLLVASSLPVSTRTSSQLRMEEMGVTMMRWYIFEESFSTEATVPTTIPRG